MNKGQRLVEVLVELGLDPLYRHTVVYINLGKGTALVWDDGTPCDDPNIIEVGVLGEPDPVYINLLDPVL